jgi:preprotein translocase subunit SecY
MKRSAWRYLWKSEDIRKKLIITVLLLVLYRLAANIPVPGIDRSVIQSIASSTGAGASLFNLLDLLSGGTISNFSILAMGVYPYITAQIIIQLLIPHHSCARTKNEGRSQTGSYSDGTVDNVPDHPHGFPICHRPG